jgi:hypothetical protein
VATTATPPDDQGAATIAEVRIRTPRILLMELGSLVMERKILLDIKERAER